MTTAMRESNHDPRSRNHAFPPARAGAEPELAMAAFTRGMTSVAISSIERCASRGVAVQGVQRHHEYAQFHTA